MARQSEIYSSLDECVDLELSWSEAELPERVRTKHVHRLHPYLGKFVPQLVEIFLHRHFSAGDCILDPYSGSGTTLVECSTFGAQSIGVDISAFNVLLGQVKTAVYDTRIVERDLSSILQRFQATECRRDGERVDSYLSEWYSDRSLAELLTFRRMIDEYPESHDLLRIVLSRSARSARMTTHFDLDFPKAPQRESYYCRKHRRECHPVPEAARFLKRYSIDTLKRVSEYAELRQPVSTDVIHGDAARIDFGCFFDGVITSPPYPGRIDYHEQHRYAFELLGLQDRSEEEIGAAAAGTSKAAVTEYVDRSIYLFANVRDHCRPGAQAVVVIDDARGLYEDILGRSGWRIRSRGKRHVNRRTGRRAGEFFEDVIVATA